MVEVVISFGEFLQRMICTQVVNDLDEDGAVEALDYEFGPVETSPAFGPVQELSK